MDAPATVALTRCTDYDLARVEQALIRQFDLLDGIGRFVSRGDSVLLKPNFIAPEPADRNPAQTHPSVVLAAARLLKDFGAKPFVADSPAWGNTHDCAKVLGLIEPLRKLDVPIRQLDRPRRMNVDADGTQVGISSVALEADVVFNLPKLKAHQQLVMTIAVKNMFGCVCGKRKALWHYTRGKRVGVFCELLINIYKKVAPVVTIIDAVVAMHAGGPIHGRAKPVGWLIGGTDPIACESLCCKLIGLDPGQLPFITTAQRIGFGCSDLERIETVGDDPAGHIIDDFALADPTPLRFTLGHVCRSVYKQAMILIKGRKST